MRYVIFTLGDSAMLTVLQVTFGETSTGAAMVQGSFVAQGASTSVVVECLRSEMLMRSSSGKNGGYVWEQRQLREP